MPFKMHKIASCLNLATVRACMSSMYCMYCPPPPAPRVCPLLYSPTRTQQMLITVAIRITERPIITAINALRGPVFKNLFFSSRCLPVRDGSSGRTVMRQKYSENLPMTESPNRYVSRCQHFKIV